jgi:hypothetical protein
MNNTWYSLFFKSFPPHFYMTLGKYGSHLISTVEIMHDRDYFFARNIHINPRTEDHVDCIEKIKNFALKV